MTHDPIADMLTAIRNAYNARLRQTRVPHSLLKEAIVKILKKNKYIEDYRVADAEKTAGKSIILTLNDVRATLSVPSFRKISKSGQRIYMKSSDIRKSRNGLGIFILSTPKGVITGYEARALNVGGELLCEVY